MVEVLLRFVFLKKISITLQAAAVEYPPGSVSNTQQTMVENQIMSPQDAPTEI